MHSKRVNYTRNLYKFARRSNDVGVLAYGNPKVIMHRLENKLIGRYLASKIWRL